MLHHRSSALPTAPLIGLCTGLLLALGALGAVAQTPPKPTGGGNKTLSGSAGNGKLMKYDELRLCLQQQDKLKQRQPELQRQRDVMDQERQAIAKDGDAVKAQNEALNTLGDKVKDFNARMKMQSDKVTAWKVRQDEFNAAGRSGPAADRQRKELEKDLAELQKAETALKTESDQIGAEREKLVAGYNERANQQEKAANDWNARSRTLDAAFQTYEDERLDWKGRCADRPYREDDEKLIRSGK